MTAIPSHGAHWPPQSVVRPPMATDHWSDGTVRCVGVAVCDDTMAPIRSAHWGQEIYVCAELEVTGGLEASVAWLELRDADGRLIHSRSTAQEQVSGVQVPESGGRIRISRRMTLNVMAGSYSIELAFGSVSARDLASYAFSNRDPSEWPSGRAPHPERWGEFGRTFLTEERFRETVTERCRVRAAASLAVGFDARGRAGHGGLVDLPGETRLELLTEEEPIPIAREDGALPFVHVTTPRSGSQWVYAILKRCAADRFVEFRSRSSHFQFTAPQPGLVYPGVYLTRARYLSVPGAEACVPFVVLRDLRDILVSGYFSRLRSHGDTDWETGEDRGMLNRLSKEDGLLFLLDTWLAHPARVQLTWAESGVKFWHFEDVIERDVEIFQQVLLDEAKLPIKPEAVREAVHACRFEVMSGGRARGVEDASSHYRKGSAGDWRTHFTPRVKDAFKARYAGVLAVTDYESGLDW